MNTKTMKILTVVFSVVAIVLMLGNVVYGAVDNNTDQAINPSNLKATYSGTSSISTFGGKIMGILQTVGVVVAVVVLMVLGIKYMMGSAEEKAEYKKTMMPYIIGALLIFGATTIANMIYNFASGL